MRFLFALLISFAFVGCNFSPFKLDKLHRKEITTPYIKLDWFFYSGLDNITADFVTVLKNGTCDTICISHNIKDIQVADSTITISFYGNPMRNLKGVVFNRPVYCELIIDTQQHSGLIPFREFYK
jgi:hypothetical protein